VSFFIGCIVLLLLLLLLLLLRGDVCNELHRLLFVCLFVLQSPSLARSPFCVCVCVSKTE
jgi:hypothetical protein